MPVIRRECPIEGYTDNFVEVTDKWTRGEVRAYWRESGEKFLEIYRKKITAVHLTVEGGEPITQPAAIQDEQVDGVDYVVWRWFGQAFQEAVNEVQRLGEEKVQQLLHSTEES